MPIKSACFAVVVVGGATMAWADVSYTAGAATFAAAPGATIDVPIFLREAAPGPTITAGGGLFAAGASVTRAAPPSDADAFIAGLLANTAAFDVVNTSVYDDDSAGISLDQSGGTSAGPALPAGGMLLLGTLTVVAPETAGRSTTFSISDFDPATAQVVTYAGVELDAAIASGTFIVTATPEPAALAGLAVAALAMKRRRS